jgi:hypothetical protein
VKRLTETEKWQDIWYRKLEGKLKLLWLYLCDTCDSAGVFDFDAELATDDLKIGAVSEQDIEKFGARVVKLPCGKFWIVGFIRFQYGKLSQKFNHHRKALAAVEKYQLPVPESQLAEPRLITPPLAAATATKQAPVGVAQGGKTNGQIVAGANYSTLRAALCTMFQRDPALAWDYAEESTLVPISQRPNCLEEVKTLAAYKDETEYFPRSVASLLSKWAGTLDQAREWGAVPVEEEKFGTPGSKRFRACGLTWDRKDGGPKREQFGKGDGQEQAFRASRQAYEEWIKTQEA